MFQKMETVRQMSRSLCTRNGDRHAAYRKFAKLWSFHLECFRTSDCFPCVPPKYWLRHSEAGHILRLKNSMSSNLQWRPWTANFAKPKISSSLVKRWWYVRSKYQSQFSCLKPEAKPPSIFSFAFLVFFYYFICINFLSFVVGLSCCYSFYLLTC